MPCFEQEKEILLFKKLKSYFDHSDQKITAETYIKMCEQLGEEVDYNKMPPSYEELPWYVKDAMEIFNSLPDTFTSGMSPIYIGKDLSSLDTLFDLYSIDSDYRLLAFKVIRFLDSRAKNKAIQLAKRQQKK